MHNFFRVLGYFEGTSFLVLMLIAMPLKYIFHEPMPVKITGALHGLLFVVYCVVALVVTIKEKWPLKQLALCWVLACLPLGTFWFDRRYLRNTDPA